jgi:hypothetical protein
MSNDLTTMPTLAREIREFSLFFDWYPRYLLKEKGRRPMVAMSCTTSSKSRQSRSWIPSIQRKISITRSRTRRLRFKEVRKISKRIDKIDKDMDKISRK